MKKLPYKCGKCGKPNVYDPTGKRPQKSLMEGEGAEEPDTFYVAKCRHCGARNKVRP